MSPARRAGWVVRAFRARGARLAIANRECIRCNAVAPGWIDTELAKAYFEWIPDPAAFRANIGRIHPVGRTGTREDVAALVAWLASDVAAFVARQVWTIDGGRMTKLSLPG